MADLWDSLPEGEVSEAPAVEAVAAEAAEPVVAKTGKRKVKAETIMRNKLEDELVNNAELRARYRKWAGSLKIINSLGYGEKGSFIDTTSDEIATAVQKNIVSVIEADNTEVATYVTVDPNTKEITGGIVRKSSGNKYQKPPIQGENGVLSQKPFTKKADVPMLVGYIGQNVGNEPIEVYRCACHMGEDGTYIEDGAQKVTLAPGETVQLTKKALVLTGAEHEYAGKFENGKLVTKTAGLAEGNVNHAELIEKAHFAFDTGSEIGVHDAGFKKRIDEMQGDKMVVSAEYKDVFGYLENEKPKKERTKRVRPDVPVDNTAVVAAFIREAFNNQSV